MTRIISDMFSTVLRPWISADDLEKKALTSDSDQLHYVKAAKIHLSDRPYEPFTEPQRILHTSIDEERNRLIVFCARDLCPSEEDPTKLEDSYRGEATKIAGDGTVLSEQSLSIDFHTYQLNTVTGTLHNTDSVSTVSSKCFLLLAGIPIACVLTIAAFAVRFFVDLTLWATCQRSGERTWQFLVEDLRQVFTSPWYALGMMIATLEGLLFDPYKGRVEAGLIEREWRGLPHKPHDILRCGKVIQQNQMDWTLYLAFCFQEEGNVHDLRDGGIPKYINLRESPTLAEIQTSTKEVCEPGIYPPFGYCITA